MVNFKSETEIFLIGIIDVQETYKSKFGRGSGNCWNIGSVRAPTNIVEILMRKY